MKIMNVEPHHAATNFKGIFIEGKTETHKDLHYSHGLEEEVGTVYNYTEHKYYPFLDEAANKIYDFVNKHTKNETHGDDFVTYKEKVSVRVMEELPMTEQEIATIKRECSASNEEIIKLVKFFKLMLKNVKNIK